MIKRTWIFTKLLPRFFFRKQTDKMGVKWIFEAIKNASRTRLYQIYLMHGQEYLSYYKTRGTAKLESPTKTREIRSKISLFNF